MERPVGGAKVRRTVPLLFGGMVRVVGEKVMVAKAEGPSSKSRLFGCAEVSGIVPPGANV